MRARVGFLFPSQWSKQAVWIVITVVLSAAVGTFTAFGQAITGDIVGAVTDPSGAVIPNANVTITNVATQEKRSATSGGAGNYALSLLQPGSYTLTCDAPGFKMYKLSPFSVGAGARIRVDVQLQAGGTSETVEVRSENVPALQTDSATVQDVVTEKAVQDLPLNGRNFVGLVQITAGVNQGLSSSIASGSRPDDRRPTSAFSANGQPDTLNNNMVDGLDNNEREQGFIGVRPSIDGISEVRVMTNDYTAEVGRSTGAVVNVLSKSGSNEFHGTLFEYFRNDIFDARDYFATTGDKPKLRQNDFGGSVGGPIFRNKTFFFGDAEWNRQIAGITYITTTPTAAELNDPTTIPGFPAGVPAAYLNPVALRYFKLYPAANLPGTFNNYQSAPNKSQFATTVDARVDHHFGANDSMFVQYTYNPVTTTVPGPLPSVSPDWAGGAPVDPGGSLFSFSGPSKATSQGLHLDYVHIFNPNLLMELRAGYMGIKIDTEPLNYGKNLSNKIGIVNGNLGDRFSSALTPIQFLDGSASLGDGAFVPILDHNNTYQYNGVLTWIRGPQTLKVGGALIRRQLNYYQSQWSPQGEFWVYNWVQFLFGGDLFTVRGNLSNLQGFRSWEPSGFVQDDWRLTKWLTLNAGLRYEVFSPFTEAHNIFSNFDLSTLAVKVAGSGYETLGVKTDYADFSPRLGLAASLPHSMVLRGGYGMSYYPQDIQSQIQNPNPPFNFVCSFGSCPYTTFPVLPTPTPVADVSLTDPVGNLTYKPADFKPGYYHQMNLVLQKEIEGNVVSVGYVGSIGRRLLFQDDINRPAPSSTPLPPGTPPPARTYASKLPNAGQIQRNSNLGQNNYNSLQATLVRQYRGGLTFNFNYTLAHGLGDSVNPSAGNNNGLWTNNPHYDYGNTAVDIRHRIAFSANYDLPFGKSMTGATGYLVRGWKLNTIAFWQTGSALGVSNGVAPQINLPGVSADRPDRYAKYSRIPATVVASGKVQCLGPNNTGACFAPQAFGTPGNARQYSEYGPHQRRVDLSLFKEFDTIEKTKLQFRAETFNITNTPNFSNPSGAFETASFGSVTSTAPNQTPRQIQLALKFLF
jgi:outer membrane receptor protein involved in Fe transport